MWTPLTLGPEDMVDRSVRYLIVVARLATDVTLHQAAGELHDLARGIAAEHPGETPDGFDLLTVPLREQVVRDARTGILAFAGAVALLLVLVCANVASLLLAHFEQRRQDVSIRLALGASRARVVQYLVSEGVLLGVAGGCAGLLLAWFAIDLLPAILPAELPRRSEITFQPIVMAAGVATTFATTLVCCVLPALGFLLAHPGHVQRPLAEGVVGGGVRLRAVLVVGEIALAFGLLVAAGLLMRSFVNLWTVDAGFGGEGVIALNLTLPSAEYPPGDSQTNLYRQLYRQLGALPFVESVGAVSALPLLGHRVLAARGISQRRACRGLLARAEPGREAAARVVGCRLPS